MIEIVIVCKTQKEIDNVFKIDDSIENPKYTINTTFVLAKGSKNIKFVAQTLRSHGTTLTPFATLSYDSKIVRAVYQEEIKSNSTFKKVLDEKIKEVYKIIEESNEA